MRQEALMGMSKTDLDSYATLLGIDVSGKKTVQAKVAAIQERRERTAQIDVLGITFTIPVKRLHDKRVTDLTDKPLTDTSAMELLELLLGESQLDQLTEAVTDEDGTVDTDAMGLALARIIHSEELKNF